MIKFCKNRYILRLLCIAIAVSSAGCRTTPPPSSSGKAATEESAILNEQAQIITEGLTRTDDLAGGSNRPLRPGDFITVRAWHQETAAMLSGYPFETLIPQNDPLFLPHFGLINVINQTPETLQQTLLESFNSAITPHAVQPKREAPGLLRTGDTLTINVWLRDNISMPPGFPFDTRIAPDGNIFVPHIGIVNAAGITLTALQNELRQQFGKILNESQVLVMHSAQTETQRTRSHTMPLAYVSITRRHDSATGADRLAVEIGEHFIMLGRVSRPGLYPLKPGLRVRDAIAMAGGFDRYGHRNIFLVRGATAQPDVIRINMNDIMSGRTLEKNILMAANDAIYVAPKALWSIADFVGTLLLPVLQVRDAVWLYDRFTD